MRKAIFQAKKIRAALKEHIVLDEEGYEIVPELYRVPQDKVRVCAAPTILYWFSPLIITDQILFLSLNVNF